MTRNIQKAPTDESRDEMSRSAFLERAMRSNPPVAVTVPGLEDLDPPITMRKPTFAAWDSITEVLDTYVPYVEEYAAQKELDGPGRNWLNKRIRYMRALRVAVCLVSPPLSVDDLIELPNFVFDALLHRAEILAGVRDEKGAEQQANAPLPATTSSDTSSPTDSAAPSGS